MSQTTIQVVLCLIRLLLVFLDKGCRLIYTIIDFVDDGIINQSAEKPRWYEMLSAAISSIQDIMSHFSAVEDDLTLPKQQ